MPSSSALTLVAAAHPALRQRVADAFLQDGREVAVADSRATAIDRLRRHATELVVVAELEAPAASTRLIEAIRSAHIGVAVVAIARGPSELDRIRPLNAGADAVAPSECSHTELCAHVDAVMRRDSHRLPAVIGVAGLEVNPRTRRVTCLGDDVSLSAKEYALLVALASDPERVFTKPELLREVWGFASPGATRTLDSHACRLRGKLHRSGGPAFVDNVWGVGYRLLDPTTAALAV